MPHCTQMKRKIARGITAQKRVVAARKRRKAKAIRLTKAENAAK